MNEETNILTFIDKLHTVYNLYDVVKKYFDFEEIKKLLLKLHNFTEMYCVKNAIVMQIQALVTLMIKNNEFNRFDNHMLHVVFYGGPGVGKSHIAKLLAQIWNVMGVLNTNKRSDKDTLMYITDVNQSFKNLYTKFQFPDSKDSRKMWKDTQVYWDTIRQSLNELQNSLENKSTDFNDRNDSSIIVAGRENFVAEYAGQTAIKSYNFLQSCLGKCVIIEEAYLLYTGPSDTYGMEALTVLNRFMDEYASSIAIIFTGYEHKLKETIFRAQPGLEKRCEWFFHLKGYTPKGLSQIFTYQLGSSWTIHKSVDLIDFFTLNFESFPFFGGDTEKLALQCKIVNGKYDFEHLLKSKINDNVLTEKILYEAYEEFMKNKL